MHAELMQGFAREILNDRIREADTARAIKNATRPQRENSRNAMRRFPWALTRRRSVTLAGVAKR